MRKRDLRFVRSRELSFVRRALMMTFIALLLGYGGIASTVAVASGESAEGSVRVERAWARPAIVGGHGAVYFTLTNVGDTPLTLVGADAGVAEVVEIHTTVLMTEEEAQAFHQEGHDHHDHGNHHAHHHHDDHDAGHDHDHGHGHDGGTFVMLHLDKLDLAPQQEVVFEPAGHHIMLINLTETLTWDQSFSLTLNFAEIPPVTVLVTVGNEPGA